eukprot:jgi/Chlat1/251/Chrsp1S03050
MGGVGGSEVQEVQSDGEAKPIYLDYNATTPIDKEAADAMLPFLYSEFGNPSSSHAYGQRAKAVVESARAELAALIGCHPSEIYFTSGGTESNNWAILGTALHAREARGGGVQGVHIVTSAIEHPAVLEPCRYLERHHGFDMTVVGVDSQGLVDVDAVREAVRDDTMLITVMHANNEVGSIQPLAEVAAVAWERGIPLHTDASQSVGKVPVDVGTLGVDMLTIAGHKFYGPKGVGALYIKSSHRLCKFMHGAGHERGMRAGTENITLIAGLGAAARIARRGLQQNMEHMVRMREALVRELTPPLDGVRYLINGPQDALKRLPNTLSISIEGVSASDVLHDIETDVAASAGSACHAGTSTVSSVLKAMNVPVEFALGTLRLSTGKPTTQAEVTEAARIIAQSVRKYTTSSKQQSTSN